MPAIVSPRLSVNIGEEDRKGKLRRASSVTHVKAGRTAVADIDDAAPASLIEIRVHETAVCAA
jgi:hypothetical protein